MTYPAGFPIDFTFEKPAEKVIYGDHVTMRHHNHCKCKPMQFLNAQIMIR